MYLELHDVLGALGQAFAQPSWATQVAYGRVIQAVAGETKEKYLARAALFQKEEKGYQGRLKADAAARAGGYVPSWTWTTPKRIAVIGGGVLALGILGVAALLLLRK